MCSDRRAGLAERKKWSEDELVVALAHYHNVPFGQLDARNQEIIELAALLGRSPNSVAMKCCNFASLDPSLQAKGTKGLTNVSVADRELYEQFGQDQAGLAEAAARAMSRLVGDK